LGKKEFIWYFLFFVVFVFSTFNGISILKTKSFIRPFSFKKVTEGKPAIIVGVFLILIGIISLGLFTIGMFLFLN